MITEVTIFNIKKIQSHQNSASQLSLMQLYDGHVVQPKHIKTAK